MPTPQRRGELSTDLIKELSYNTALLDAQVSETEPRLLPEQKDIYNNILQRVELGEGGLFFFDSPGGTGKTFLLNLFLAKIRKDRNVALAVASSGIAATLLSGGRAAHSVFKLPLNLTNEETPTCNISKNSARAVPCCNNES
ncbi:ATP-dependent DNA helicase [Trichonephila clavipes]|nr:ATP-dependent DNA helicase [Trichonephila clavipes]